MKRVVPLMVRGVTVMVRVVEAALDRVAVVLLLMLMPPTTSKCWWSRSWLTADECKVPTE